MTRQEALKQRIRQRMAHTGERYTAARRVILAQASSRQRRWVSEPEVTDATVAEATGRGWDAWCDLIEASNPPGADHRSIAASLRDQHGVDAWWAQTVTVGYERITGRRLPYQQPDGTFTASRSRTVNVDAAWLRAGLLDAHQRSELLPDLDTVLRSRPTSKAIRLGLGTGMATFSIAEVGDGRAKLTVSHERLATFDEVDRWRFYWAEWLAALDLPDGPDEPDGPDGPDGSGPAASNAP